MERDFVVVFCNAGEMWNAVLLARRSGRAVGAIDAHL